MKVYPLIIGLLGTGVIHAETCRETLLRRTQQPVVEELKVFLCRGALPEQFYSKGAPLEQIKRRWDSTWTLETKFSSPAFSACKKIGGQPELVQIFSGGTWKSTDRCLLGAEAPYFVSGDLLLHLLFNDK